MASPQYISTGTYSSANGATALTPAYPASPQAGDLMILQVGHQNHVVQHAATYSVSAAFTLWFGPNNTDTREIIYYRIADGTESGTLTVNVSSGTTGANHRAGIHLFRGTDSVPTAESQGSNIVLPGATTVSDTTIITAGPDRLALNFVVTSSSQTPASFAGETGGDWTLAASSGVGVSALWLEIATLTASGTTLNGGVRTLAATTAYTIYGFALIPPSSVALTITAVGVVMGAGWGGVPIAIPFGAMQAHYASEMWPW